ncbi:MAG: nickel pincer cofactor biosynthesis protein LarC [Gemmatimonadota bacterium]
MARAIAYFDCFSGISGDMVLGALVAAGLDPEALRAAIGALRLPGVDVTFEAVQRQGIAATRAVVSTAAGAISADHEHHLDLAAAGGAGATHHHHGGHGPHTHLADILQIIDAGRLEPEIRDRAAAIFRRLAEAEAEVHGVAPEGVHLHEVGALDAVVDIVGAVAGLHLLGVSEVYASPLSLGTGTVDCAHGRYPVPAPGVLALCRGVPVVQTDVRAELVTPTGAAIITTLARSFGPPPPHRQLRVGYGAGGRDLDHGPNVLRLRLGEVSPGYGRDRAVLVEANIDDMNPEIFGYLFGLLLERGALDVYVTPVHMKKGRPGHLLSVLAPEDGVDRLADLVLAETTTLGVRLTPVERRKLAREAATVDTPYGPVRVKVCRWEGGTRSAPEYEDCARIARERRVPLQSVYRAAAAAAHKE